MHDGAVFPGKGVLFDLFGQASVGKVVLCHDQKAAGVLVDAVDNAGADDPVDAGQRVTAVVEQCVD